SGVRRISPAGALRRRVELVPRVELVAESEPEGAAVEAFLRFPAAVRTVEKSASSATIALASGELVHLDAARPSAFASTLLEKTGSERHIERLRELARAAGVTVAPGG